jgi:G:T-mismatch repair DNA endonuclease (very short patch repair protein)
MYLSNIMREMPTGAFVRRRRETNFRIEKSYSHGEKAIEWLKWMEHTLNTHIQHMFNNEEKRVGGRRLPVDGYARLEDGTEVVLQYSGCWYHSHLCDLSPSGIKNNRLEDLQNQIKTYETLEYFKQLGYKVYHVWECAFMKMKAKNQTLKEFCQNLNVIVDTRFRLSEKQIITEVKEGTLFGMVECDLHVPEELYDVFSEFQPVIKHAYVSRDDIGDHMRNFAETKKLLKKPTKTLLCSYFAKRILLATPLLQWYLKHGLIVTRIYQVIQYNPRKCFQKFGEEVMSARREGDQDPRKKIMSDSVKLIGM